METETENLMNVLRIEEAAQKLQAVTPSYFIKEMFLSTKLDLERKS